MDTRRCPPLALVKGGGGLVPGLRQGPAGRARTLDPSQTMTEVPIAPWRGAGPGSGLPPLTTRLTTRHET